MNNTDPWVDPGQKYGINWIDAGWVLVSSVLVFIMTPANGFFYSGTIEFKNALSVIFICAFTGAVVTVQWFLLGYSLTFAQTTNGVIGDLRHGGLANLGYDPHPNCPTIPSSLYMFYQLMFAQLTPALAFGSIAERTRIIPWAVFLFLWCTLVYDPIAYWTWNPNGWLTKMGIKDFAGGLPVHIVSGFSGLAAAIMVGKRSAAASTPHNLTHTLLGTALLTFGWFGFNAGSECRMDLRAVNAAVVTYLAACFGGVTWVLFDYRLHRKITSLGFCSGVVAGLVCITPGAGFVSTTYAPLYGIIGSLAGNLACFWKGRFDYDDSLDAFAVHGVVGFVGLLLTGVFADKKVENLVGLNTTTQGGWINGNFGQMLPEFVGGFVGSIYVFVVTAALIWVMDKIRFGRNFSLSLRMSEEDEAAGTDFTQMGEVAYDFTHTGQKHIEAMLG